MSAYLGNLLGAVSLAVADKIEAAAAESVGLGGQTAPALVLIAMNPQVTIKLLAERLRLSHPAAVRMVERLESADLVKRVAAKDRREARLVLTRKGLGARESLRRARQDVLGDAMEGLSSAQKAALEPALVALAQRLAVTEIDAWSNCRLCDADTCAAHGCPVAAWEQQET